MVTNVHRDVKTNNNKNWSVFWQSYVKNKKGDGFVYHSIEILLMVMFVLSVLMY